jgi:hypothetical protein
VPAAHDRCAPTPGSRTGLLAGARRTP